MKLGVMSSAVSFTMLFVFVGFIVFNWISPIVDQDPLSEIDLNAEARRYFRVLPLSSLEYAILPQSDQLRVVTALEFKPSTYLEVNTRLIYTVRCDWYASDDSLITSHQTVETTRLYFANRTVVSQYEAALRRTTEGADGPLGEGIDEATLTTARTRWYYLRGTAWISAPRGTTFAPPIGEVMPTRAIVTVIPGPGNVDTGGAAVAAPVPSDGGSTVGATLASDPTAPRPAAFLVRSFLRTSRSDRDAEMQLAMMSNAQRRRLVRFDPMPATFLPDEDLAWQLQRDEQKWSPIDRPGDDHKVVEVLSDDSTVFNEAARQAAVWETLRPDAVIMLNLEPGDRLRVTPDPPHEVALTASYLGLEGLILRETRWLVPGLPRYFRPPFGTETVVFEGNVGATPVPVLVEIKSALDTELWIPASPDRVGLRAVRCDLDRGDLPLSLSFPYPLVGGEQIRLAVSAADLGARRINATFYDRAGNVVRAGALEMPAIDDKLEAWTSQTRIPVTRPSFWYCWVTPDVDRIVFEPDSAVYIGFSRKLTPAPSLTMLPRGSSDVIVRDVERDAGSSALTAWQPVLPDDRAVLEQRGQIELVLSQLAHVNLPRPREPAPPAPFQLFSPTGDLPKMRFIERLDLTETAGPIEGEEIDVSDQPDDDGSDSASSALYRYQLGGAGTSVDVVKTSVSGFILVDEPADAATGAEPLPDLWVILRVGSEDRFRHPVFPGVTNFSLTNLPPGGHRITAQLVTRDLQPVDRLPATVRARLPVVRVFGSLPPAQGGNQEANAEMYAYRSMWAVDPGQQLRWPVQLSPGARVNVVVAPELFAAEEVGNPGDPPPRDPAELARREPALWTTRIEPRAATAPGGGESSDSPADDGTMRRYYAFGARDSDDTLRWLTWPTRGPQRIFAYGSGRHPDGTPLRLGAPVRGSALLGEDMQTGEYDVVFANDCGRRLWVRMFRRLDQTAPQRPATWTENE